MSFVLASGHNIVRWYVFDTTDIQPGKFKLVDRLDLSKTPTAGDKETAKFWAIQLGLKSWKYVKVPA